MLHDQLARRLAARGLVSLSKLDVPQSEVSATATSGLVSVTVIIAPVRFEPVSPVQAAVRDLRAAGYEAAHLARSSQSPSMDLSETDRMVLSVLSSVLKKKHIIAREAGYSESTNSVKTSLAKLVRLGLAVNVRGRGYRLA